ncbi:aspartic protein-like protein 1 [Dorcoceras hygrometricum]|uniref:Aspartic protein-like protein 1 n=1 Tax=Dorcoceras hygrometricum TaxID=472368 RepID=A0A2Z7BT08_9LAMI|nr:aspartic protein-like protein 1 [Dorcoceras hygrometricum]
MASSLFINTLQVDFASVLTMEHTEMVRMFKSLEDTGLRGFLEGTTYVFENAVTAFFANAKVISGTIKVLMSKSVQSYIKKNQDLAPEGETSKRAEDTASNTDFSMPHQEESRRNRQRKRPSLQHKLLKDNQLRIGVTSPRNFDSEEVTEPDPCPLVTRRCRRKQVSKSPDSESTISLPLKDFVKRRRTQRQHQHMGWSGITIASQPDSIPVSPTEEARISGQDNLMINSREQERIEFDQIVQGGGDDCFGDDLEFDARMDHEGQKDQEITADEREGSHYDSIPTVPVEDAQMGNDFQTANQGCETQMDFMNPTDKVSDDIRNEPAPVKEYCQLLITSAWDNVSTRMTIFEEWLHFRKEVRIKDISSFDPLVTIEEQLLEWGETEEVSDLFERRSLIMYKVLELELEKLYYEHLANFKLDSPSVNHDFLCIRRLHKELRMIAVVHRDHRAMAGLSFINQDISYLESASHQQQSPALEFSSLADHEQGAAKARSHQTDQQAADDLAMTSHKHRAQENESPIQTDRHQAEGNEHQAQDEHGSISGFHRSLDEPFIMLSVTNPMTVTTSEKITCDHQVTSLDLTCARINDDMILTKHHTTLLHEQLKNVVDGLDIKIDVLEQTFSKRMDYNHQHFTQLETNMVHNYSDSNQQLVDELDSVKSQLATMVESMKEFGADKKGEGGHNRQGQGLNRTEEGSSGGQSSIQYTGYRQSGPRPDTRLLRQPALEGLTRSARTDSPRRIGRKSFSGEAAAAQGGGGY